jgi:hypothetical protein
MLKLLGSNPPCTNIKSSYTYLVHIFLQEAPHFSLRLKKAQAQPSSLIPPQRLKEIGSVPAAQRPVARRPLTGFLAQPRPPRAVVLLGKRSNVIFRPVRRQEKLRKCQNERSVDIVSQRSTMKRRVSFKLDQLELDLDHTVVEYDRLGIRNLLVSWCSGVMKSMIRCLLICVNVYCSRA